MPNSVEEKKVSPSHVFAKSSNDILHDNECFSLPELSAKSSDNQEFSELDFQQLAKNEYYRYTPSSSKVAHALIFNNQDEEKQAYQFSLPCESENAPTVVGLHHFEAINRYGKIRYRAIGPDGKKWYAKRHAYGHVALENELENAEIDLAFFSEEDKPDKEPFWGSSKRIPRFSSKEKTRTGHATKGGYDLPIDYESVQYRRENRKRSPDQNQVMGRSARDAYEFYFVEMEKFLSPAMKKILKDAFEADHPISQLRPEWLHAYAHSLMPKSKNPQQKDNLGAAPKWSNTEMMVLERIAQWFTENHNSNTKVSINSLFKMLGDSDLINIIEFKVSVEFKARIVRFKQELDTFKIHPVYRKASDLAQAAGVTHALLHGTSPISSTTVHQEKRIKSKKKDPKRIFFPESDSAESSGSASDADSPSIPIKDNAESKRLPPSFFTPSFFDPSRLNKGKQDVKDIEEKYAKL